MSDFLSGIIAGIAQTAIGHPFDTIKTRIQLYPDGCYKSISNLYKYEGVTALYKGSLFPLFNGCIQNGFLFWFENNFYNQFQNHAVSGFLSGSLVSLLTTPSDIVKCTIQNEKSKHLTLNEAFFKIDKYRFNMYTGFTANYLRESFNYAVYFSTYYGLQSIYSNPLINGGISGITSWTSSYVFDVIKTNKFINHDTPYHKLIKIINWKNSFKGLGIVIIRAFFVNAGIFQIFELTKELL